MIKLQQVTFLVAVSVVVTKAPHYLGKPLSIVFIIVRDILQ